MGTRALVRVKDTQGQTLVTLYRQYDGYPSGLGNDIKKCFEGRELVNGFQDVTTQVNGMGCAAALLVSSLKGSEAGGIYLHSTDVGDCGQEYEYVLYASSDEQLLYLRCEGYDGDKPLYDGPLNGFDGNRVEGA